MTNRLGLQKEVVQWFHAAEGMGMLLGGALGAVFASRMEGRVMLSVGILFLSLSAVGEALSVWPLLTWCFRFTGGFFLAFINISVGISSSVRSRSRMVGRVVNGLVTPIFHGHAPVRFRSLGMVDGVDRIDSGHAGGGCSDRPGPVSLCPESVFRGAFGRNICCLPQTRWRNKSIGDGKKQI